MIRSLHPDLPSPGVHRLRAADGVGIAVDHYHHASRRPSAIVISPGYYQFRRGPRSLRIAAGMYAAGFDVITFDFRGHGESGGWYTFGSRETSDLEAVIAFARPKYERLGVLGFSMGGTTAIRVLAESHAADALVACAPVANLEAVRAGRIHWPAAMRSWGRWLRAPRLVRGVSWHLQKPKALDVVDRLSPTPVLFIHGTRDWLIHVDHSRWLHEKARDPKRLALIESVGHAEELFDEDPRGFVARCRAWWAEHGVTPS